MRRAFVLAAIGTSVLVPSGEARASGGGGCGAPVTQGIGDAVAIRQFCFEPTVLVMPTGGPVTFTNEDDWAHNVLGANGAWGSFARMNGGKARAFALEEPGVYPFLCTWHPGMAGAVVVGDGGAGLMARNVGSITAGHQPEASGASDGWRAAAVAVGGLLVLIVAGTAGLRRRLREDDRA